MEGKHKRQRLYNGKAIKLPFYIWNEDEYEEWKKNVNKTDYGRYIPKGQNAPEGHPRRCQHPNHWGFQCGRWALRNHVWCWQHWRRHRKTVPRQMYLEGYAGKRLSQELRRIKSECGDDILNLETELVMARQLLADNVQLYGALLDSDEVPQNAKMTAQGMVAESLNQVTTIADKYASVLSKSKMAMFGSIDNILLVLAQVKHIVEFHLKEGYPDLFDKIDKEIDQIRVTQDPLKDATPRLELSVS